MRDRSRGTIRADYNSILSVHLILLTPMSPFQGSVTSAHPTQGLRPGLHSRAAARLFTHGSRALASRVVPALLAATEIRNEILPVIKGNSINPIQGKSVNRESEPGRQP